jgi:hypothetical protein
MQHDTDLKKAHDEIQLSEGQPARRRDYVQISYKFEKRGWGQGSNS